MNNLLLNLYVKIQSLMNGEEGQDLVEYALLVTLIALACIAGISSVSGAISGVFTKVSTSLA